MKKVLFDEQRLQNKRAAYKRWYEKNKYKLNRSEAQKKKSRKWRLKSQFNMTPETWELLFQQQNKCCAICKTRELPGKATWHIDHCHNCNVGLGHFQDNTLIMQEAIRYLNG